ncbi:MAG: tRNA (N6-threonylcarbamoyladenosine(37)-N6)-methyltransferase TrmO [Firmicutes bacterium]|nr:tRNA (N6-threonylcarbamoyladenosine(37)-N6)-methyltransferase TrmO [Bacillota bacterium]
MQNYETYNYDRKLCGYMNIITLKPIGVIHSTFTRQDGTPIQSSLAGGERAEVEIFPEFQAGLRDLDGFDRIYLIYYMHKISEAKMEVIPYLDDKLHGIFATRSPCRPNPIGLSCVRLISVKGNILEIEGADMLDGTPLIDMKPYNPDFDVFEVRRKGWFETAAFSRDKADARFEKKHESIS